VKTFDIFVLLAVLGGANGFCLRAIGSEGREPEKAERLKFLAGYHSASPEERREAVRILTQPEYRDNHEVGKVLCEIAWFNTDPEARLTAFQALCTWHDEDGSLACKLAQIFKHDLEATIKPAMAQAMTRLAFKTDTLNELIFYIRLLGGSDDHGWGYGYENNTKAAGAAGLSAKPNTAWDRNYYRTILGAINQISGKHFVPSYDTGRQLLNWWRLNAVDFQRADSELALGKGKVTGQAMVVQVELDRKPEAAPMDALLKAAEAKPKPKSPAVDEDELD
jgi:hypothetical protein